MYRSKPVTKTNLANSLGIDVSLITQFKSKQMFTVRKAIGKDLYSYYTKVGHSILEDGRAVWRLTTKKYSVTTSKQLTQFASWARSNGYDVEYSSEI